MNLGLPVQQAITLSCLKAQLAVSAPNSRLFAKQKHEDLRVHYSSVQGSYVLQCFTFGRYPDLSGINERSAVVNPAENPFALSFLQSH